MSHVLTLIADPAKAPLTPDAVEMARKAAHDAGARLGEARELGPREAWECPLAGNAEAIVDAVRTVLDGRALDVNVLPAENRRKKLLLADMDSTMIGQECIDELADVLGLKTRISAITERAMRGEIAFEPALRERVGLLKGLDAKVIGTVIDTRITLTPGGKTLIATMKANDAYCALVSGGFTAFTRHVARIVGFDENRANTLLIEDDLLSGEVAEPILGKEAKLEALRELTAARGLRPEETLCVGDGANDLAMIEAAGLGVAYHAKPAVAARAHARINHGDLTALLFLQGYARADFAIP